MHKCAGKSKVLLGVENDVLLNGMSMYHNDVDVRHFLLTVPLLRKRLDWSRGSLSRSIGPPRGYETLTRGPRVHGLLTIINHLRLADGCSHYK